METLLSNSVTIALIGVVVFQQVFFLRQIQKLVDKAMSKDFAEYQHAAAPKKEREKVPENYGIPEDFRVLQRL